MVLKQAMCGRGPIEPDTAHLGLVDFDAFRFGHDQPVIGYWTGFGLPDHYFGVTLEAPRYRLLGGEWPLRDGIIHCEAEELRPIACLIPRRRQWISRRDRR